MKITGLQIDNFLSFGCGEQAFQLDYMHDHLTVLLGPNGSGKTNVITAVRTVLSAVEGKDVNSMLEQYHRPDGNGKPIEIRMDVSFDREYEQNAIALFLKMAIAHPPDGLQVANLPDEQGKEVPIRVSDTRKSDYANWVDSSYDRGQFAPMFQGSIVLRANFPIDRNILTGFITSIEGSKDQLFLNFTNGKLMAFSNLGRHLNEISIAKLIALLYGDKECIELAQYLSENTLQFPALIPVSLKKLVGPLSDIETRTSIAGSEGYWGKKIDLHEKFIDAIEPLGIKNSECDLSTVFKSLILRSVGSITSWHPKLTHKLLDEQICTLYQDYVQKFATQSVFSGKEIVPRVNIAEMIEPWTKSPFENLITEQLALYLFRLEHGSKTDLEKFKQIGDTFQDLTNQEFALRLKEGFSIGWPRSNNVQIVIENQAGLPLEFVGSGLPQCLFLSAVKHGFSGSVMFLDEPELHLHPTLQMRLSDVMAELATGLDSPQYVIVAHSPYLVPNPSFEYVRRICLEAGRSISSKVFTKKELDDPDFRPQTKAYTLEDKQFLFANCCVFVEGPIDAGIYRGWFQRWAEDAGKGREYAARLGVVFQPAIGASNLAGMLFLAKRLIVRAIGVCDTDILRTDKPEIVKQNKQLMSRWKDLGFIPQNVELSSGSVETLRSLRSPLPIRLIQPDSDCDVDFTFDLSDYFKAKLPDNGFGKSKDCPAVYEEIAKQEGLLPGHSDFLRELFNDIEKEAKRSKAPQHI